MADADVTIRHVVIVGLGNPGVKYSQTRHNIGYLVVKALAARWGYHLKNEPRFDGYAAKGFIGQNIVHLLMPTTYMNLSGVAIRKYLNFYKLGPESLIVLTDDIALGYGELRVREKGTSGGHNGLKNVESVLGTKEYIRVRMGIGKPQDNPESAQTLSDYVLATFTSEEASSLKEFINQGIQAVEQLIAEPVTIVMNAINKKQQGKLGEEKHES